MTRRVVRVTADLLFQLDRQLPAERGPKGEPTRHEFAASDLLDIVDTFAAFWDDLPVAVPGRPDYRDLLVRCRLVYAAAVRGQLSPIDGAVELIAIKLDIHGPDISYDEDDDRDD